MSTFAEIDADGRVLRVIVIEREMLETGRWGEPKDWVETKEDGSQKKNYAGIGYAFDAKLDAFVPPKPYESWSLDETKAQWKAPVEAPKDGKFYGWDEATVSWKEATGGSSGG